MRKLKQMILLTDTVYSKKSALLEFDYQLTFDYDFSDSIENKFWCLDKEAENNIYIAETQEEAQKAIDGAVPGFTIQLVSGADYGTLYFRQNTELSTLVEASDWAGNTKNEYYREFKDVNAFMDELATFLKNK